MTPPGKRGVGAGSTLEWIHDDDCDDDDDDDDEGEDEDGGWADAEEGGCLVKSMHNTIIIENFNSKQDIVEIYKKKT